MKKTHRFNSYLNLHLPQFGNDHGMQCHETGPFLFLDIGNALLCLKLLNIRWAKEGEEGTHCFDLSVAQQLRL